MRLNTPRASRSDSLLLGRLLGRRGQHVERLAGEGFALHPVGDARGLVLDVRAVRSEHPGVLRPTALTRVHDEASLAQRDARETSGHDPDVFTVVERERPEIEVPRPHLGSYVG